VLQQIIFISNKHWVSATGTKENPKSMLEFPEI
jgi:hypothetical protein